jgi:superfamily II DNA or RNA helicase
MSALLRLPSMESLYTVPGDDLVGEVLVPAMSASTSVRCMTGFFSSNAFRHIAPGIAAFVNGSNGVFELLISPILEAADKEALQRATDRPRDVLENAARTILERGLLSESALERHTRECLAYLFAANRLVIRFVLMRAGGMFHPKVWIFLDGEEMLVAHGSSNVTPAGLLFNFETVSIERAWMSPDAHNRAAQLNTVFERLWLGRDPNSLTIDAPAGFKIARTSSRTPPTVDDFWRAWHEDAADGLAPPLPPGRAVAPPPAQAEHLQIPPDLEWQSGPFVHQASAVHAWEAAMGRGLLAMATGSGKTVTALICATRLQDTVERLLVIIAAPYIPLIEQWHHEVNEFGVRPVGMTNLSSAERSKRIAEAARRLDRGTSSVEVAVVTHDYLVSDHFARTLADMPASVETLLIADEVHNLGRPRFVTRPPERFSFRIGLSATPVLQYNAAGTDAIRAFFGDTVFEFGLADAIGVCLVPYNYYVHLVELDANELAAWEDLTGRLMRLGFVGRDEGTDEVLSHDILALLVKRRAVLEAAASKITMLRLLLEEEGVDHIEHTLVYCSDKRPEQLVAVNQELLDLGVFVRQLTAAETTDRRKTNEILTDFGNGDYQVITCKRVLDEGVDIPQVRQAFLLASSTVRRQWVQRRGRILRKCDAIGKTLAHLHDFIVVPSHETPNSPAIVRQELDRARAFAELAANAGSRDGPFATLDGISN